MTNPLASLRRGPKRRPLPADVDRPNAFALWMASAGLTPEAIAAMLKVSPSSVYHWRRGARVPGRRVMWALAEMSSGKVSLESWRQAAAVGA